MDLDVGSKSTRHFDRLRKGYASVRKSLRIQPVPKDGDPKARSSLKDTGWIRRTVNHIKLDRFGEAQNDGSSGFRELQGSFRPLNTSSNMFKSNVEYEIEKRLERSKGRVLASSQYLAPNYETACDGLDLDRLEAIRNHNFNLMGEFMDTLRESETNDKCSCRKQSARSDLSCCCRSIIETNSELDLISLSTLTDDEEATNFQPIDSTEKPTRFSSERPSELITNDLDRANDEREYECRWSKTGDSSDSTLVGNGEGDGGQDCDMLKSVNRERNGKTNSSEPDHDSDYLSSPKVKLAAENKSSADMDRLDVRLDRDLEAETRIREIGYESDSANSHQVNSPVAVIKLSDDSRTAVKRSRFHQDASRVSTPNQEIRVDLLHPHSEARNIVQSRNVKLYSRSKSTNLEGPEGAIQRFSRNDFTDNSKVFKNLSKSSMNDFDNHMQDGVSLSDYFSHRDLRQEDHIYATINARSTPIYERMRGMDCMYESCNDMFSSLDDYERTLDSRFAHGRGNHSNTTIRPTTLGREAISQIDLGVRGGKSSLFSRLKRAILRGHHKNDSVPVRCGCKPSDPRGFSTKSGTLTARSMKNQGAWVSRRKSVNLNMNDYGQERKSIFSGFLTIGRKGAYGAFMPGNDGPTGSGCDEDLRIHQLFQERRGSFGSLSSLPSADSGLSCTQQQNSQSSSDENYSSLYRRSFYSRFDCDEERLGAPKRTNSQQMTQVIGIAKARVDCNPCAYDRGALVFKRGDMIDILERHASGTWVGRCQSSGQIGHFKFINVIELNDDTEEADHVTKLEIGGEPNEQPRAPARVRTPNNHSPVPQMPRLLNHVNTTTAQEPREALNELGTGDEMSGLERLLHEIGLGESLVVGQSTDNSYDNSMSYLEALRKAGIDKLELFSSIRDARILQELGINNNEHLSRLLMAARIMKHASRLAINEGAPKQVENNIEDAQRQHLEDRTDLSDLDLKEPTYVNIPPDQSLKRGYSKRLQNSASKKDDGRFLCKQVVADVHQKAGQEQCTSPQDYRRDDYMIMSYKPSAIEPRMARNDQGIHMARLEDARTQILLNHAHVPSGSWLRNHSALRDGQRQRTRLSRVGQRDGSELGSQFNNSRSAYDLRLNLSHFFS